MDVIHRLIGYASLAGAIGGAAWALWLVARPRALDRRALSWLGYAVVALTVLGAATGAFRQTSGGTPGSTHPIFAALAIVAVPVAQYLAPLFRTREPWVWLAGYAVTALAVVGLFQTG
jgi:hypothetical protein